MQTETIALKHLRFGHEYPGASLNARQAGRDTEIAPLAASIKSEGVLQSLLVCPGKAKEEAFVIAGNRRLKALQLLCERGDIAADYDVPVIMRTDVTPTDALRMSLAENEHVPLHPVDRFEAFAVVHAQGAKKGHTPDEIIAEIAARYATTEKVVRQSLALGRLAPKVREAWRAGEINAESAQTFTLEPDTKRQEQILTNLQKRQELDPYSVRHALVGNQRGGDHDSAKLVAFVGIEAYEKAGGKVMRDLFKGKHGVSNPALAKKLADEKLKAECDRLVSEGWAWASPAEELPYDRWHWIQIEAKPKYEPGEKERIAEIDARLKKLQNDEFADDDEDDYDDLEEEKTDIVARAHGRAYTSEQKAKSGCEVSISRKGELQIKYGVVKPADKKNLETRELPRSEQEKRKKKQAAAGLSNALAQRLSEQLTFAIGAALAKNPKIAIPALIAGFAVGEPVVVVERGLKTKKATPYASGVGELRRGARKGNFASVFQGLIDAGEAQQRDSLAAIAAAALDFQVLHADLKPLADKNIAALCTALEAKAVNAAVREQFDAKDYFAGINSTMRLQAILEACGEDARERASKLKKDQQAKFAIDNVPKTGWLPPELRTSHYDGPTAPAKAKSAAKPPKAIKKSAAKPKRKAA